MTIVEWGGKQYLATFQESTGVYVIQPGARPIIRCASCGKFFQKNLILCCDPRSC